MGGVWWGVVWRSECMPPHTVWVRRLEGEWLEGRQVRSSQVGKRRRGNAGREAARVGRRYRACALAHVHPMHALTVRCALAT